MSRVLLSTLLAVVSPVVFAQEKPKKDDFRKPVEQWVGVNKDVKLKALAKPGEVITEAEAFEKVWKGWQPKMDIPKVDFATQFVVVTVSDYEPEYLSLYGGPMWKASNSNKSPKKVSGFGWGIGVYDRKGVEEVNGKKLPEPAKKDK